MKTIKSELWSTFETNTVKRLIKAGHSVSRVAKTIGRPCHAIYSKLYDIGQPVRYLRNLGRNERLVKRLTELGIIGPSRVKIDHKEVFKQLRAGKTVRDVATAMSRSRDSIDSIVYRAGFKLKGDRVVFSKPARPSRVKIDHKEVFKQLRTGKTVRDVATAMNTPYASVRSVVYRAGFNLDDGRVIFNKKSTAGKPSVKTLSKASVPKSSSRAALSYMFNALSKKMFKA